MIQFEDENYANLFIVDKTLSSLQAIMLWCLYILSRFNFRAMERAQNQVPAKPNHVIAGANITNNLTLKLDFNAILFIYLEYSLNMK